MRSKDYKRGLHERLKNSAYAAAYLDEFSDDSGLLIMAQKDVIAALTAAKEAAEGREKGLREALEPFALIAYAYESTWNACKVPDEIDFYLDEDCAEVVTVGDFRKVTAALDATKKDGK